MFDARAAYEIGSLDESSLAADPFAQFELWFEAARSCEAIVEPHAMTLATVGDGERPAARIVLLRGYGPRGFAFFTNYESRKGRELSRRPYAALLFWWGVLQRQIRIEGTVERLSAAESDEYFTTRPRGHQLSAWASRQSTVVPDRGFLEAQMRAREQQFAGQDVERPPYWGGFRVEPDCFEFWQGRRDRMHDRILYEREPQGWRIVRLSP